MLASSRKKLILGTLSTTVMATMAMTVVACSEESKVQKNPFNYAIVQKEIKSGSYGFGAANWSMAGINWAKVPHVDAVMNEWIDGDTPIVNLDTDYSNFTSHDDVHIRIAGIDTPELHVEGDDGKINVLTTGKEFQYAEAGRVFGNAQIPHGTKIRIATSGSKSYDRIVGSIFYGDNFEKSYSVEIMKKGLAYPFIGGKMGGLGHTTDIMTYIALPISDAYNLAHHKKIGIFGADQGTISKIHGSTDVSQMQWEHHTLINENIYKTIEVIGDEL